MFEGNLFTNPRFFIRAVKVEKRAVTLHVSACLKL